MDIIQGPLSGKIIRFALPIAASSMMQQLFNAADTAIVGKFGDANALAAVGTNGEIVALLVSLSLGLSVGANVFLARLIGGKKTEEIQKCVQSALLLAVIIGVVFAVLGQGMAKLLLKLIDTPEVVLDEAVLYLRIYFLGYPALVVYDFGSAVLRSKGDSRLSFMALTVSGIINVGLNLVFVIGCHMGVAGVALATDLASLCAAMIVILLLMHEENEFRFSMCRLQMNPKYMSIILKIGIPAALQGAVFCFANLFVQAAVNGFGAKATAGSAIAMNFEYFGYYMITAFGQAATTFVSQNDAAGNKKRCRKILRLCLIYAFLASAVIIGPLIVFRTQASGIFSSDSDVVMQACLRMMVVLIFEPICGFYEVPAGYLRGIGHSTLPAVMTIIGTCCLRIIWIETYFARHHTLQTLFVVFPISWVVTIGMMWMAIILLNALHHGNKMKDFM